MENNMKNTRLIFLLLLIISCFPKLEPNKREDRLFLKEVNSNFGNVEWFYYSSAVSESPDYIIINKRQKEDTIVISTNIADIGLENDSIKLSFYGKPKKYNKDIAINFGKYPIKIDTTIISSGPTYRKFYKKP